MSELSFSVSQSTLPFREAQLAAGCPGSVRDCGSQVAAALDSEELVVSGVEDAPQLRHATLRLLRFVPGRQPRAGAAQLPREADQELSLTVYALVESLFADRVSKKVASAPPVLAEPALKETDAPTAATQLALQETSPDSEEYVATVARVQQRRRLLAIGWPTLTAGAGLLVGGLVANLAAWREADAYDAIEATSAAEVDAKLAHERDAQDKAQAARVLWGVGGGLAAAGIFVLLWERFALSTDRKLQKSAVRKQQAGRTGGLTAAASPHGVALSWSTEL